MVINFLGGKFPIDLKKENWKEGLSKEVPPKWRTIIYAVSWIWIVSLSVLFVLRIIVAKEVLWLKEVDIILLLFILQDFILLNRLFSRSRVNNEKFWFWFFVGLLFLNFVWSTEFRNYSNYNIYSFNIYVNYLIVILGLIVQPYTKKLMLGLIKSANKLDTEIEAMDKKDNDHNERIEISRKNEFSTKFPLLSKIPIVSIFLRWVYKEEYFYSIGLIALLITGLIFRLINLGKLGYSTDEGSTALYSYIIGQTGLPCGDGICYLRGLPYLYFVSLFTKIFGVTEFWVRFPGVLITSITLVTIYFLVKSLLINKTVALLTVALLTFADWHFMLGRYARMYGMLLFFVLPSILFYYKVFYDKKNWYIVPLILSIGLAVLTHQFGLILIFFLIEPLLARRFQIYKNIRFIIFGIILSVIVYLGLTQIPGIIYHGENFYSIYDISIERAVLDQYWYLQKLQEPNWIYIGYLFKYFPIMVIITIPFIFARIVGNNKSNKNLIIFFIIVSFLFFAFYKIDYNLKYLWWILALINIPFSQALYYVYKLYYKKLGIALIVFILASDVFGIHHILSREYGGDEKRYPLLMSSSVEPYHPDDKTIVEYVAHNYRPGDIIIHDYWMQDNYLQITLGRHADYFVSRWTVKEYLSKFPFYKLYEDQNGVSVYKGGSIFITSLRQFEIVLNQNTSKRIWYISSEDYDRRANEYISLPEISDYLDRYMQNKVVYRGKDNNTKVYLFE